MDERKQLERISKLMDSKFTGPLGIKFGLDGIIGLIPGVGDFITNLISSYIILAAVRMGVSLPIILRMLGNLAVENIVDLIPILGNLFDFLWKANEKNLKILKQAEFVPKATEVRSLFAVIVALTLLVALFFGVFWLGYEILTAIYELVQKKELK